MTQDLAARLASALGDSYQLGEKLGEGGMGIVYRGTDRRLNRDVAIKVLPPQLAYREDLRKRFVREAQLAAGLSHPNIVPIHDVGEHEDLVWFVMGYVDGESVRDRVEREGPLSQALTRRIVREVAWALAYAHARGIVHRDIKPENILLERSTGRALVTDFGIAKITETDTTGLTAPGAIVGSLRYMAPEQAGGESVDGRADLYSLGLVAYYMLSGEPPFPQSTVMSVATRALSDTRPDFTVIDQRPAPQLRAVLERCVAPHPGDRWTSAERMLEALGPEGAAPAPMPSPIRRLVRDFLLVPTFGLIVLIANVITDQPTVLQFVLAIFLILAVNFVVSLRSFARRGYGWADLRDAIDMETLRQREELEATVALRERFRAIVYVAVAGGTIASMLGWKFGPVNLEAPSGVFWVLAPLGALLGAWFGIRIAEFLARIGARLLPSLPKPESSSWFARLEDRLLTLLFRPIHWRRGASTPGRPAVKTDMADARRSVAEISDHWKAVTAPIRKANRRLPILARDLASRIDRARRDRLAFEGWAERTTEALDVVVRESEAALGQLQAAIQAAESPNEESAPAALAEAIRNARRTLVMPVPDLSAQESAPTAGQRMFPTFTALGRLVDGLSKKWAEPPPTSLGLAGRSHATHRSPGLPHGRWPDVEERVNRVAARLTRLRDATERGRVPADATAAAAESTQACERALEGLLTALERYRDGDAAAGRAVDEHLAKVDELERRIDALLEVAGL